MLQIEKQREDYYRKLGTPPGVPTMKGATAEPENTHEGYNSIIKELGDHSVPDGWIQRPKRNAVPGTPPGPPVQWDKAEDPDDVQPGYGYVPADTTHEDIFFYHSDHLGSTSYITDAKANVAQFDAYLPYGELLVDEHSSTEEMPYKFNGKEFDEETGLYYYGARYMNPKTSLWYGVDPLAEKYPSVRAYVYCLDNPINLIDPNGKDWFKYQAKSDKKATWHFHKGNTATYIGGDGKIHTSKKGFEYLAVFTKSHINSEGGTVGTLTLYHQDKKVVTTSQAFSGNENYTRTIPIDNGDYYMRLDIRKTSNPVTLLNTPEGLQPEKQWGIEYFPKDGKMIYNRKEYNDNSPITNAYCNSRIRLIPGRELRNTSEDRGLYLHGKLDRHFWTHGCLCDKKEKIQNYFLFGGGKNFRGKVPLLVK